jgi:hypothetical protein
VYDMRSRNKKWETVGDSAKANVDNIAKCVLNEMTWQECQECTVLFKLNCT